MEEKKRFYCGCKLHFIIERRNVSSFWTMQYPCSGNNFAFLQSSLLCDYLVSLIAAEVSILIIVQLCMCACVWKWGITVLAHFCTQLCAGGSALLRTSLELHQSYIRSLCAPAVVGGRAGSRWCFLPRSLVANTPLLQHLAGKEGAELLTCFVSECWARAELTSAPMPEQPPPPGSTDRGISPFRQGISGTLFTVPLAWNSTVLWSNFLLMKCRLLKESAG